MLSSLFLLLVAVPVSVREKFHLSFCLRWVCHLIPRPLGTVMFLFVVYFVCIMVCSPPSILMKR